MNVKVFRGLAVLFVLSAVLPLSANEVTAVWGRLYGRASTVDHKLAIMQSIVEQHDRDMIPVLTSALDEQVRNLSNQRSATEETQAYELIKMIVKELGRLKASQAATYTWEVVEAVDDPFLKGEAVIALGKMGARQYAGQMATMLRNLNFNYDELENQRANEVFAYALVLALERLKAEEGYEPIFFASMGWYSSLSGVKERAKQALAVIVEDPTQQLHSIMENNERYSVKTAALDAGLASQAPDEAKASLATFALQEGLRYTAKDGIEKRELKSLRLSALRAIGTLQTKDPAAAEPMESMLIGYQTNRIFEEDTMLTLLDAMGGFQDDEVAKALASFLSYQTERRQYGASDSLRIAKATIQALGSTGSSAGFEALTMVTVSEFWEGSVRREAKAALQKLNL
ncbi:hypothetical protein [Sediminispirochaeta bajacaliforniensis]|uniref:hypothetical protein n=1 Tax=Sediminispirochaeta bajacaliforniensis TaxID=148 RepID=UPI00037B7196|nr:hypothetical protein [Sediminispirochaeta bajacaliforniensis]